jgi:hypothetical protein
VSDKHAVPWEDHSDHSATSHCACGPEAMRDLLAPSSTIWRHRLPGAPSFVRLGRDGPFLGRRRDGGSRLSGIDTNLSRGEGERVMSRWQRLRNFGPRHHLGRTGG